MRVPWSKDYLPIRPSRKIPDCRRAGPCTAAYRGGVIIITDRLGNIITRFRLDERGRAESFIERFNHEGSPAMPRGYRVGPALKAEFIKNFPEGEPAETAVVRRVANALGFHRDTGVRILKSAGRTIVLSPKKKYAKRASGARTNTGTAMSMATEVAMVYLRHGESDLALAVLQAAVEKERKI